MRPQWFDIADIPYEQMWEDDKIWLPELLNGQDPFFGRIYLKRKPFEETKEETEEEEGKVTVAAVTPASTTNISSTMATTALFSNAQPKCGPFAMFEHHLDLNLNMVPKEIAFDGTIASYED